VGQGRPSETADEEISRKIVTEFSRSGPPGTISLEQARELLDDPTLTDDQVGEFKEQVRLLVDVIYEKWLQDRSHSKGATDSPLTK
jgi:hypothetical protein